jgi:NADH-quinone oxidoreductase subunit J
MTLDVVIFIISAAVALFSAVMMIAQRNPVASVLYLIVSLVAQAVIYVQLGAVFVGVMLVIVYAGAILVLFLFVIMLLNLRGKEDLGKPSGIISQFTKMAVSILLFVEMVFIIRSVIIFIPASTVIEGTPDQFGSVRSVSMLLFTKYLYPFELTGVLLLIAVVGAVVIARKDRSDEISQNQEMVESTGEKSDQMEKP